MDIQDFIVNRDQHMRPLEYDLSENFNELLRYLNDMGVLDNVPIGVTSESEIVSISDAYPAPPRALNVFGKSTQNGTPTPDAPVPILSVDDLTVHASADGGTTDYTNWPVSDLLPEGTKIRSLPSGNHDILELSYLRPSESAGWAWYSRTLNPIVGSVDLGDLNWDPRPQQNKWATNIPYSVSNVNVTYRRCDHYTVAASQGTTATPANNTIAPRAVANVRTVYVRDDRFPPDSTSAADFKTGVAGINYEYILTPEGRTPITLDPIELPTLPAPNATVWCDGGSATPTLILEYVRDANAAIAELSEAIADIVSG